MYNDFEFFVGSQDRRAQEDSNLTQQARTNALTMQYSQSMIPVQQGMYPMQFSTIAPQMNMVPNIYHNPIGYLNSASQSSYMSLPQQYPQNYQSYFAQRQDVIPYYVSPYVYDYSPENAMYNPHAIDSMYQEATMLRYAQPRNIDGFVALTNTEKALQSLSISGQLEFLRLISKDKIAIMAKAIIDKINQVEGPNKLHSLTIMQFIILAQHCTTLKALASELNVAESTLNTRLTNIGLSWMDLIYLDSSEWHKMIKKNPDIYDVQQDNYLNISCGSLLSARKVKFKVSRDNLHALIKSFVINERFLQKALREFNITPSQFHKQSKAFVKLLKEEYSFIPIDLETLKKNYVLQDIKDLCLLISHQVGFDNIDNLAKPSMSTSQTPVIEIDASNEREELNLALDLLKDLSDGATENFDDTLIDDNLLEQLLDTEDTNVVIPASESVQETVTHSFGFFANSESSESNTAQKRQVTAEDLQSSKKQRTEELFISDDVPDDLEAYDLTFCESFEFS